MSHWLDGRCGNTCSVLVGRGRFMRLMTESLPYALRTSRRPDLVFLDIVMPGVTGLKVLERLDYEPKVIFHHSS